MQELNYMYFGTFGEFEVVFRRLMTPYQRLKYVKN